VTGSRRRSARTERIPRTSTSGEPLRAERNIVTAVISRIAPNTSTVVSNERSAAAPSPMTTPRNTRAPAMPNSRTRCCSAAGTEKAPSSSIKTNRLSTDSDFSTRYPVMNSMP